MTTKINQKEISVGIVLVRIFGFLLAVGIIALNYFWIKAFLTTPTNVFGLLAPIILVVLWICIGTWTSVLGLGVALALMFYG